MKLPKGVQLLKKVARKALGGVGYHDCTRCPINRAYRIHAGLWYELTPRAIDILHANGWSERTYKSFLEWYDARNHFVYINENILGKELEKAAGVK